MDAHLLADERGLRRRPGRNILASAEQVDGHRGLVTMRDGPDDVLRTEGGVTAEEDVWNGRLMRPRLQLRQTPAVELQADVALDPGKGVLLPDGDEDVVAGDVDVRLAGRHELAAALLVLLRRNLFEGHAGQATCLMGEGLRHQIVENRDALMHRVLLFPGRGLHLLKAGADDDGDLLPTKASRGTATIHRRVAAAEHDDAPPDALHMAEGDGGKPFDADMDVCRRFLAAGYVEVAAARRAGADEDRVVPLRQQCLQAAHAFVQPCRDAEAKNIAHLFVDHLLRQAEARDLGADHAAGLGVVVIDHDLVADRRKVACDGEGGRPAADAGDALAVSRLGRARQARGDVAFVIGRDTLQAADRDRLLLHPAAPAGRLAGAVASAAENAGEDVGPPVDHVGLGVAALRDHADVFGNRRMRRAGVLAVHDLVEMVRGPALDHLHTASPHPAARGCSAPLVVTGKVSRAPRCLWRGGRRARRSARRGSSPGSSAMRDPASLAERAGTTRPRVILPRCRRTSPLPRGFAHWWKPPAATRFAAVRTRCWKTARQGF